MKKLALALVCFASVAFFASCQQEITNPEPTISVITDDGFVKNGDVIDVDQEIVYGFQMASNSQTKKELKQLSITTTFIDIEGNEGTPVEEIISLAGKTEYRFVDTVAYVISDDTRDVIGSIKTVATVTDIDGKINTATLTLSLNQTAQPLNAKPITWVRRANNVLNADEMAQNGLQWTGSYRDIMATIEPLAGCTMYLCNGDEFANITTDIEEAAFFANLSENSRPIEKYREISATLGNQTPNDMLAVIDADGNYHLVLFSTAKVESITGVGTQITINGQVK